MWPHHWKGGVGKRSVVDHSVVKRSVSAVMATATVVALVTLTPTPATADPAVPGDAAQELSELESAG